MQVLYKYCKDIKIVESMLENKLSNRKKYIICLIMHWNLLVY
jgi:hypothetical protein